MYNRSYHDNFAFCNDDVRARSMPMIFYPSLSPSFSLSRARDGEFTTSKSLRMDLGFLVTALIRVVGSRRLWCLTFCFQARSTSPKCTNCTDYDAKAIHTTDTTHIYTNTHTQHTDTNTHGTSGSSLASTKLSSKTSIKPTCTVNMRL